jgi:membrane associated rhomboid family serine protease
MTDPVQTLSRRVPGLSIRARVPYAAYALVALNVALLVAEVVAGDFQGWVLDRLAQDRVEVWEGEWWRLLTATFVHEGWQHLLLNMLLLVSAGGTVERLLGPLRFLALYLVSGLSGALFFQAFAGGKVGIGASGAILGVFGAYLLAWSAATSRSRRAAGWKFLRWAVFIILADAAFAYVVERTSGLLVATSAHAGGFVAGALLGRFFEVGQGEPRWGRAGRVLALAGLAAVLGGAGAFAFLGEKRPQWPELEGIREFERLRRSGDPEAAVKAWNELPLEGVAKRESGYLLWDWLMAEGRHAAAAELLDALVLDAGAELKALVKEKAAATPELVNELAWYLALQGEDLMGAFELADRAVRGVEGRVGGISGFLGGNRLAAICINTRGWVRFLRGESEPALKDLREAAELSPTGANLLYLAIAHAKLGSTREAREAGRRAREEGGLTPYERRLLEDLEEDVGGF